MKFLVDEALPRSLSPALRDAGFDALDIRDVGLGSKPDEEVFSRSVSDGRVLISKDLDFTDSRRFPPDRHLGILIVRYSESIRKTSLVRKVVDSIKMLQDDEVAHNVVILEPTNIRFWRKPSTPS